MEGHYFPGACPNASKFSNVVVVVGSLSGVTSYVSGNMFTELAAIYLHKKPFVFMCSTCPSREVDHFLGWTASPVRHSKCEQI